MRRIVALPACLLLAAQIGPAAAAGATPPGEAAAAIRRVVDATIVPLMRDNAIPGMAVALTIDGRSYTFDYGVASRQTQAPVGPDTLFELGSISKTFAATLAAYAQAGGALAWSDPASKFLPQLRGSAFDDISLLNLATHTSGGLPLQVPDGLADNTQLLAYFAQWKPLQKPGTYRVYSNPGIGLLGLAAARSLDRGYEDAIEKTVFPELGMTHSYLTVPVRRLGDYAQGYNGKNAPVRMSPGPISAQAYGVRSTAADMLRFVDANLRADGNGSRLSRALLATHTGYYSAAALTQDLVWEQYPLPLDLKRVLAGNAETVIFHPTAATALQPPLPPRPDVLLNKTGSTNGFAAYVAFVPVQRIGIVLLANHAYPIAARVNAAYRILTALDPQLTAAH